MSILQHFLNEYLDTKQPMLHLMVKKNKFIWTPDEQNAFKETKQRLLEYMMLVSGHKRNLHNTTDGYKYYGNAEYLYQLNDNQEQRILTFMSRILWGYKNI